MVNQKQRIWARRRRPKEGGEEAEIMVVLVFGA